MTHLSKSALEYIKRLQKLNITDASVEELRLQYAEKLADLSPEDQIKEMKQFMCDMMDWMQQTDCGDMYIKLHETLNE